MKKLRYYITNLLAHWLHQALHKIFSRGPFPKNPELERRVLYCTVSDIWLLNSIN